LKVLLSGFVCLLLATAANGQANSQPVLKPRPTNPVEELQPAQDNSKVPPDAAVITINGVCDKSAAATADCKTVITREQFEKVINSIQPTMPKAQQKQFATRYVNVVLLADKAHELGLDKGPAFDEQMYLARLQILARLGGEQMQKEASKVSDQEIADYYSAHAGDFRTISYEKIYVPKQKQLDTTGQKPNDPDAQKKRESSDAAMKDEADKLRARAAAGEDFPKLQQEAYDFAGMKLKANNTPVEKVRKTALPPTDAAIFDLKKGEISHVFNDPQGYMIYKVEDFQDQPLADVREEVSRTLQNEKVKKASEALQKTAASDTTYDDAYFGTPAPASAPPTLRNPGEPAPAKQAPQPPGKK
jgi:PPIC-type PPIASE domain